jgi:hypothetical protein
MSDLGTYLRDRFEEIVEPVDVDALVAELEAGEQAVPPLPRSPAAQRTGWLIAAAAALIVLIAGAALFSVPRGDEVTPADLPIPSDDGAYVDVAEAFMEAWIAGDADAGAALFSNASSVYRARVVVGGVGVRERWEWVQLHRWFRAVKYEFREATCRLSSRDPRGWRDSDPFLAPDEGRDVLCAFTFENELTRVLGREPVAGAMLLPIDDRDEKWGVATAVDWLHFATTADVWHQFGEWVAETHPEDYDVMFFDPLRPHLDSNSITLWEQHVAEFATAAETTAASPPGTLSMAEYEAEASRICASAFVEFTTLLSRLDPPAVTGGAFFDRFTYDPAAHRAAVRISEAALEELRALQPPRAYRSALDEVFAAMEEEIEVTRHLATASSAADIGLVDELTRQRVDLTHFKDGRSFAGGLSVAGFQYCPVNLGA